MLITHVKPGHLWGKRVYDADGRFLGAVVAVGSRHGVVRKVVIQRKKDGDAVKLSPPSGSRVERARLVVPVPETTSPSRLRIVR
jgi:hypothetical protein